MDLDIGLLVIIAVFAVFVPVGIISYLVVIPRLRGGRAAETRDDGRPLPAPPSDDGSDPQT